MKGKKWLYIMLAVMVMCLGLQQMEVRAQESGSINSGLEVYQADVVLNGYEGNSAFSHYEILNSLQKPLYYELTDYLLENKMLSWNSNFWNAAFNQDFKNNPSYFYEVIIMSFLKFEQKQMINLDGLQTKERSLAVEIYSDLCKDYSAESVKDLKENFQKMTPKEAANKIYKVIDVEVAGETVSAVEKLCATGKDLVDAFVEYKTLQNVVEERIAILKEAKECVTDNAYFTKAIDDVIEKMEETPIEYTRNEALHMLLDKFLNKSWELIVKGSPIEPVLKAIDIEKMTLDVLFNTSDTASNNFKLLVVYINDTYFHQALGNSAVAFQGAKTKENAGKFMACYRAYLEYQMYGLDYTKTFMKDIVNSGPLHNLIEQIFFRENIENERELSQYCDRQISMRKQLLESLESIPDVFYAQNNLLDIADEIEAEEIVPVKSISFLVQNVTLNHMDDIFVVQANVYPQNATNKRITYQSSDSSILEVSEWGGFVSIKRAGIVTVTATSEDGGYQAMQTISIGEGNRLDSRASGKCGKDLYWVLYSDGTLNITGSGEMFSTPWFSYREEIKRIILSEEVTKIERYAFNGCSNLKSIHLPERLTRIEDGVFQECSSLENIDLPENLISIGGAAFNGCSSLESIDLSERLSIIESGAFSKCSSLKSIDLQENLEIIEGGVFSGCSNLETIQLPEKLTIIGDSMFSGCSSLESINLPEKLDSIGRRAFLDCRNLKNIDLPEGVSSIGEEAFSHCYNLKSIKLPKRLTSIEERVFDYCRRLESVSFPEGLTSISGAAFRFCESLKGIDLPEGLISIGGFAFDGCSSLENISLPESLKSIGDGAFDCHENTYLIGTLKTIKILNEVCNIYDNERTISKTAIIYGYSGSTAEAYARKYDREFVALDGNIADGSGGTGTGSNTNNVPINPADPSINNNTISTPSTGTKLTDPITHSIYTVTASGTTVAYTGTTNKNATTITIPATVKINNITYKVTSVSANAFKNNKKLKKVTIPNSIRSIGASAFQSCTSLTAVKMGNSVTTIGNKAFYNCKKLTSVSITKNTTTIGNSAFENCVSLKKITVPAKVKKIGNKAFYSCKKLNNLTIQSKKLTAKNVGNKAFTRAGSSAYKKLKVKVPSSKYTTYKKLLQKKGLSAKAKITKK